MRENLRAEKKANEITSHDIKLELDVRCQKLIEKKLHAAFPKIALLGEEGDSGDESAEYRWVVDPIDGTVNFAHGIPHASVSIALQKRDEWRVTGGEKKARTRQSDPVTRHSSHVTLLGVVYDPFQDELWTAIRGQPARLNGRVIRVSPRRNLKQCIVSIGFAKSRSNLERALPSFTWLARRVMKIRMMGSAALALTYVASGRLDVYIERGISLWGGCGRAHHRMCRREILAGGGSGTLQIPDDCQQRTYTEEIARTEMTRRTQLFYNNSLVNNLRAVKLEGRILRVCINKCDRPRDVRDLHDGIPIVRRRAGLDGITSSDLTHQKPLAVFPC